MRQKPMKKIMIGLLVTGGVWASLYEEYVPCEKTYIDPHTVNLFEKKIKIDQEGNTLQTSAIYADSEGLFYKDYLHSYEDEETTTTLSIDLKLSDKQMDHFENSPPCTNHKGTTPSSASPITKKPPIRNNGWPYSNKHH
jgi:hypothetical protein